MTAWFYDTLGLFSAFSAIAKILFQETWCRSMQLEEILPQDIGSLWHAWIISLPLLADIDIPRWMGTSNDHDTQIHVFCDASERAYGAVLYVRSSTREGVIVRLACSKIRLAQVKKITLPCLEIFAALVGARLVEYFCLETGLDIRDATYGLTLRWFWAGYIVIPVDGKHSFVTGSRKYRHIRRLHSGSIA